MHKTHTSRSHVLAAITHRYLEALHAVTGVKNADKRVEAREDAIAGLTQCVDALTAQCAASDAYSTLLELALTPDALECATTESETCSESETQSTGVVQTPCTDGIAVSPGMAAAQAAQAAHAANIRRVL